MFFWPKVHLKLLSDQQIHHQTCSSILNQSVPTPSASDTAVQSVALCFYAIVMPLASLLVTPLLCSNVWSEIGVCQEAVVMVGWDVHETLPLETRVHALSVTTSQDSFVLNMLCESLMVHK